MTQSNYLGKLTNTPVNEQIREALKRESSRANNVTAQPQEKSNNNPSISPNRKLVPLSTD